MTFGLSDVTVQFGDRKAIDSVNLDIEPGSVTVLVGADGAGKTTTARGLVGLALVSTGVVRRPPNTGLSYQPAMAGTWLDLTVAENLAFVARAYNLRPGSEREVALLELTDLAKARDRLSRDLSGGMRQKLAIAMSMLPQPELAVLDEPTTGLDPLSRVEVWKLLIRAAAEGSAVLVTTTYLSEAERASLVVVLDSGRVLATGSAASIRESFQGTLSVTSSRPDGLPAWRRGNLWRVWSPGTAPIPGASPVAPDLEDVVTAAAMGLGAIR